MKQYIGTKLIEAEPAYRCMDGSGKVVITPHPEEAFPNYPSVEEGYRVRYPDGYASWSPKAVFEEAYRPTTGMSFGLAIEAAKKGHRISRAGWNGKGQYVEIAAGISTSGRMARSSTRSMTPSETELWPLLAHPASRWGGLPLRRICWRTTGPSFRELPRLRLRPVRLQCGAGILVLYPWRGPGRRGHLLLLRRVQAL